METIKTNLNLMSMLKENNIEVQIRKLIIMTIFTKVRLDILSINELVILTGDAGVGKSNFLLRYKS